MAAAGAEGPPAADTAAGTADAAGSLHVGIRADDGRAVIVAVPVLVLYVFLQRFIVQSVATTGLKG